MRKRSGGYQITHPKFINVQEEELGQGWDGIVTLVRQDKKNKNKVYALKKITNESTFFRETNVAEKLKNKRSPYIAKVYYSYEEKEPDGQMVGFLKMEYANDGNLLTNKIGYTTNLKKKLEVLYQICKGVKFLKDNRIVHGDLHRSNILCNTINGDIRILITDFGNSVILPKNKNFIKTDVHGMYNITPPETHSKNIVSYKSDVWAIGSMASEFFGSGMAIITDEDGIKEDGYYVPRFLRQIKDKVQRRFVRYLLNPDREKRPDIEDVLKYPIFDPVRNLFDLDKKSKKTSFKRSSIERSSTREEDYTEEEEDYEYDEDYE